MHLSVSLALVAGSMFASSQDLPRRPVLGLPLQPLPAEQLTKLNLAPQTAAVVGAGPLAGDVKAGDILVAIEGTKFRTFTEMNALIRTRKSGDKVKLTMLQDDGKTIDRSITLSERPRDPGDQTYEVIYDQVVSNGTRHRVIVTKPKREGKHPVFFWIQGIGLGTVDFPLTANNGTAKILKSFSDDGFVTVRVEKTGLGDSEGGPADKVSYDAETDIFREGIRAINRYSFADRSQVYVFGHSMGGCHAPIIAADTPIKGIISYGTVSDSWLEWQIKADRWQAILGGADPKQVDQDVRKTVTFYGELYNERKSVDQIVKDHPDLAEFARQQSPDGVNMSARSIDYMRGVNDKNFSDFWSRIGDCRVLALFGENDFVALESCQTQIPVIVNRLKPGHATFQKVKESDHGFSKTTSFQDSIAKWGKPGSEFNPEVIRVCKEWIKQLGKSE